MKNQQLGILLLLATTLTSIPLALTIPATKGSITRHFNIYQNNRTAGCPASANPCFNSTSPGPPITVNQGDSVQFTIHDNDTDFSPHTFKIASSAYTAVDTGTMTAGQIKTLSTFTASTSGTFTYQCDFHPTTMRGTFKVNPVSSTPITPASLLALLGTTVAAVYVTIRKRR